MPTSERSHPASSFDVAKLAGVSRSTVSHILNGRGVERFPQETRDRVLAAAATLEYRPSPAGRSLVKGRSDTIVVLAPNTTWGGNLQDAVDRVIADTASLGANVVVRFAGPDRAATINAVLDLRPLAVIDLGFFGEGDRERLRAKNVITVPSLRAQESSQQGAVDERIAHLQVAALQRAGARRVVFASIADDRLDPYGPRRFEFVRAECERLGLPEPSFERVPLRVAEAVDALSSLLSSPPIGFACYNDDVALAVLAAARESGKSVPSDVSVIGVDATEVGQLWSPRLTSVDVDIRVFMDAAVDELRSLLAGEAPRAAAPSEAVVRLIDGEST